MATIMLASCNEENETPSSTEETETATTEASIDAAFEDLDDLAGVVLEQTSESGGRISQFEEDDRLCEGVFSMEGSKESGTITLDFGDGCIDKRGNLRKGKIVIDYQGRRFEPGSVATTTPVGFSINDMVIEGIRTVENISDNIESAPTFHTTLADGKITWPDGTIATRTADKTSVLLRDANPVNDQLLVTGAGSGTTRKGVAYNMTITDTLVYQKSCRPVKRGRIPVAGVKVFETDDKTITIDFGDGECDGKIDIIAEGTSNEVTMG